MNPRPYKRLNAHGRFEIALDGAANGLPRLARFVCLGGADFILKSLARGAISPVPRRNSGDSAVSPATRKK